MATRVPSVGRRERPGRAWTTAVGGLAVGTMVMLAATGCSSDGGEDESAGTSERLCNSAADAAAGGPVAATADEAVDVWFADGGHQHLAWMANQNRALEVPPGLSAAPPSDPGDDPLEAPERAGLVAVDDHTWAWAYAEGRRVEVSVSERPGGWSTTGGSTHCFAPAP